MATLLVTTSYLLRTVATPGINVVVLCLEFSHLSMESGNMASLHGTSSANDAIDYRGPPYILVVRQESRYQFLKQVRDVLALSHAIPEFASIIRSDLSTIASVFPFGIINLDLCILVS